MFQPDPYLATNALFGGIRAGSALGDLMRQGRRESELSKLAQLVEHPNPDYSAISAGFFRAGDPQSGMKALAAPMEIESNRIGNQYKLASIDNFATDNQLAQEKFAFDKDYRNRALGLQGERLAFDERKFAEGSPQTAVAKIRQDLEAGRITPQQADALIANATAPKQGIVVGPDGTVTIGGSPALTTSTRSDLQKGVAGDMQLLDQLEATRDAYDPEFLTYGGALKGELTRQAEKLGGSPGAQNQRFLQGRTKFVTQVERSFNAYRQAITGAAAAVQELDRLKKSFINMDMSPSQFEAAYDAYESELKRSIRLRNRLLREGVDPRGPQGGRQLDTLFASGADDDVETRGSELAQQGLSEPEILAQLEREGYAD